jgi:signal transduction histidine kinase
MWSAHLARMMFDQSPFSSVLYDAQGHIIAANVAFSKLWGVDLDSAPPGYCVLRDPELERQGVLPLVQRAFAGEAVMTPAIRYDISKLSTTGAGRVLWTQGYFYPLLDEQQQVRMVLLTHINLTDHIESELKLRVAVADLQTLQGLTADLAKAATTNEVAAVALDRARPAFGAGGGLVVMVDGDEFSVVRHEGFAPEQIRPWLRFPVDSHTVTSKVVRSGVPVFIRKLQEVQSEFPEVAAMLRAAGYLSTITLPLHTPSRIIGTLSFNFAVEDPLNEGQLETLHAFAGQCALSLERAVLHESERAARAEAESANRTKSEFLARMSHELRTPLNAIDGYAELLELGVRGELSEAQLHDVARIRRSQKHLLTLIDDVLTFARIESGIEKLEIRAVEVWAAIEAAHETIAPQLDAKGLSFSGPGTVACRALADPEKLQQILINLLANAVKFTQRGGITVAVQETSDDVEIAITDTGIGIPGSRLHDIFDPFVQVDVGNTRVAGGTGLGLTIARDFARRMRGDLTVQSELGHGATFTLKLPAALAPHS